MGMIKKKFSCARVVWIFINRFLNYAMTIVKKKTIQVKSNKHRYFRNIKNVGELINELVFIIYYTLYFYYINV